MRTYPQDERRNQTLYQYYYECIRRDIEQGELPPGTKLPSKRAFATNHGVSIITVENTYGQLAAEGYIYSKPKSGYFVSDIFPEQASVKPETDPVIRSDEPYSAPLDLTSQRTAAENFPFSTWTRLMRRQTSEQMQHLMIPSPSNGIPALRQAIARHLLDFRGIHALPDQIIIGAGTEYLYGLLISLLGRDKLYALENPGYDKPRRIYHSVDAETVSVNLDQQGICISALNDSHADIVQVSPSHQFPTGIVMPITRRYELLAWASARPGRYIIEDDYDSELRLSGRPIPALFSIDQSDQVIYINTFTKSLSPTIRISYMVLPVSLCRTYQERLGYYSCTVSNFEQYTLAAFIQEGFFEKHINRMRSHYRELRDQLICALTDVFPADTYQISEQDSGIFFLLQFQQTLSETDVKETLLKQGVRVAFLNEYYDYRIQAVPDPEFHQTMLINYSSLTETDIPQVATLLYNVIYGEKEI